MTLNFRVIGKLCFLLVIFGFFMPIACDMNGFQLANTFKEADSGFNAMLLYILFLSAIAGLAIGVLLLLRKTIPVLADWVTLGLCIISGLIVYFSQLSGNGINLQSGAYVILIGWIAVSLFSIVSKIKNET